MENESSREMVYQALELALKKDRVKSNISKISELGLVEMTRKRTRESFSRLLGELCAYCDGLGYVKSKTTICYDIFREIERISSDVGGNTIMVDVNPEVAEMLCDEERGGVERLEKKLGKRVVVQEVPRFHQDEFEIVEI
jgi:ribonuclease G